MLVRIWSNWNASFADGMQKDTATLEYSLTGFFFFFGHAAQHVRCGILVPRTGIEPLQWKHRVLTTGPPGKFRQFLIKLNNTYKMIQPSHSRPLPERNENICLYKALYANVCRSFTHNSKNLKTTPVSINRWRNKLWHISTMEYQVSNEINEQLNTVTWINLKIMQRERNQAQMITHCILPFVWASRKD